MPPNCAPRVGRFAVLQSSGLTDVVPLDAPPASNVPESYLFVDRSRARISHVALISAMLNQPLRILILCFFTSLWCSHVVGVPSLFFRSLLQLVREIQPRWRSLPR